MESTTNAPKPEALFLLRFTVKDRIHHIPLGEEAHSLDDDDEEDCLQS